MSAHFSDEYFVAKRQQLQNKLLEQVRDKKVWNAHKLGLICYYYANAYQNVLERINAKYEEEDEEDDSNRKKERASVIEQAVQELDSVFWDFFMNYAQLDGDYEEYEERYYTLLKSMKAVPIHSFPCILWVKMLLDKEYALIEHADESTGTHIISAFKFKQINVPGITVASCTKIGELVQQTLQNIFNGVYDVAPTDEEEAFKGKCAWFWLVGHNLSGEQKKEQPTQSEKIDDFLSMFPDKDRERNAAVLKKVLKEIKTMSEEFFVNEESIKTIAKELTKNVHSTSDFTELQRAIKKNTRELKTSVTCEGFNEIALLVGVLGCANEKDLQKFLTRRDYPTACDNEMFKVIWDTLSNIHLLTAKQLFALYFKEHESLYTEQFNSLVQEWRTGWVSEPLFRVKYFREVVELMLLLQKYETSSICNMVVLPADYNGFKLNEDFMVKCTMLVFSTVQQEQKSLVLQIARIEKAKALAVQEARDKAYSTSSSSSSSTFNVDDMGLEDSAFLLDTITKARLPNAYLAREKIGF